MNQQQSLIDLSEPTEKVLQKSRQPKNNPLANEKTARAFITSMYNMAKKAELDTPAYSPKSSVRDAWLRQFSKNETHLAGTISTCVSLDTNRGYSLVGGRNQVVRYSRVLRDVEGGNGWRELKQLGSQDYYTTDMGQVTEVESDGRNGPLISLYHVDSVRCELTGNSKNPLIYTPNNGKEQAWKPDYFYRICSLPNPDERFNKLGYCAVSRVLKLAQVMTAVVEHNLEKLNTLLPNGILAVESDEITQESWEQAFEQHQQVYPGKTGNEYYDRLIALVSRSIKIDLTAFSQMPENFDPFKFTDYLMRGYALCFNRDPRAFWSINSGNFGSGHETEMQAERATQSGYVDYLLQDQEYLQKLLPASLLFQYEEDDTQGKLLKAELLGVWADTGIKLLELGLSTDQVLGLMVKEGIIDSEFTPEIEDEIATDDEGVLQYRRQQLIEKSEIQQAVQRFPDEPIVEYRWPDNKTVQLWKQGKDAIKAYFQINGINHVKPKGSRQKVFQQRSNFGRFRDIVDLGLQKEIDKDELQTRLVNYQLAGMVTSYFHEATTEENRTALEQTTLEAAESFLDNDALLEVDPIEDNEEAQSQLDALDLALLALLLPGRVQEKIDEIYLYGLESDFFEEIESGYFSDNEESIDSRIGLWEAGVGLATAWGFLYSRGDEDILLQWTVSSSESCETCQGQEGLIMTRSEWQASNILPGINTNCQNWCKCFLNVVG